MGQVAGLLLAAGAGTRMGRPKALVRAPAGEGTLVERGLAVLRQAGCSPVVVVLGAGAAEARPLAASADELVVADDWQSGQSASLRRGLEAVVATDADAVCVLLVDLPDVEAPVLARVATAAGEGPMVLARAAYDGVPGHPVLIGRSHWPGVAEAARGDRGARDYLASHHHLLVECGDLATGRDVDTAEDLG